jgi:hypothetical protein
MIAGGADRLGTLSSISARSGPGVDDLIGSLYLAYVPYGCVLFDRLIAATGVVATAVFMIYVTDAFGYVGSVGVLLFKNFGHAEVGWLDFLVGFSWVTATVGGLGFLFAACTSA